MNNDERAAWTAFWAQSGGRRGGCLPGSSPRLERAQYLTWKALAQSIVPGGRVLDLATGDGRVMAWMLDGRPDLEITGIDFATELPPAPSGTSVRTGIAMEDLPFRDAHFHAVVSQFGFEYGDIPAVAREVRRVLASDGVVGLMTHRRDGPILTHNLARRDAIRWAIDDEDLPGIARRSLDAHRAGAAAVPQAISEAPAQGRTLYGNNSAAWEIAEAIRRSLALHIAGQTAQAASAIDAIARMARDELRRISALEAACEAVSDETAWASTLQVAGLAQVDVTPVSDLVGGTPFADFRTIRIA